LFEQIREIFTMRHLVPTLGLLFALSAGTAEAARDMTTDRPDATESPYTVEPGHVQLEASLFEFAQDTYNTDHASVRLSEWNFAPFNLRIGLAQDVDLHVILETHRMSRIDDRDAGRVSKLSGTGDVTLRLKYNFWGNDGGDTALGIMPFVKLPTGKSGLGNNSVEGGVILPVALELGAGWALGAMTEVDFVRNDANTGYSYIWLNSASFSHDIVGALGGFLEVVSEVGNGPASLSFNSGLTYGINEDLQLDLGTNVGISRSAEDLLVFVGVSKRW